MFPINENLVEFFGIMFGDGKLTIEPHKTGYRVQIWLDSKAEPEYAKYVYELCRKLFSVEPAFSYEAHNSVICIRFHAKQTVLALHRLGIPLSHIGRMPIPAWISTIDSFSAAFLRGLFDTDGGVVFQRDRGYTYRLIKFSMKSHVFAKNIQSMLLKLGFHPYICACQREQTYQVVMRKKIDILLWRKLIGTSNLKNEKKLEQSIVTVSKWERRDLNPKLVGWSHA